MISIINRSYDSFLEKRESKIVNAHQLILMKVERLETLNKIISDEAAYILFKNIFFLLPFVCVFLLINFLKIVLITPISKMKIYRPYNYFWLSFTKCIFSSKTQKDTFEPAIAEWDFEIYEALKENKDSSLFMINVRNTYGFIMAMWQKSPLGDLIEYVRKIAS
jgi:hypothetical protein